MPVLIGTGAEWTDEVVRTSREAESMGADGVMIIPPFYSVPTDDELYRPLQEGVGRHRDPDHGLQQSGDGQRRHDAGADRADGRRSRTASTSRNSTLDPTRVRDIIRLAGDKMTVFAGVLGYEFVLAGRRGLGRGLLQRHPALVGRAVRAGRRQARHGCSAGPLQEDDAAAVVGRRPALRLGHQGLLRDDGHADGPAARPAPAAARGAAPGAARGAAADGRAGGERRRARRAGQ